jgi:alkaline phosphatase
VLHASGRNWWLMIEAGDVDWANHDDNLDNSIGAVISGDAAVRRLFDWLDRKKLWNDTVVIVTADHGHYFQLVKPEALVAPSQRDQTTARPDDSGQRPWSDRTLPRRDRRLRRSRAGN